MRGLGRSGRALMLGAIASALLAASVGMAAPGGAAERTVVGESVRGRPIAAWRLGPAAREDRVLVFGCIHGDEAAGIRVARRLIAGSAPRRASLWTVPSLNPDGVAAGTRGNARAVDLNRNFPFEWRPLGGLEYSGPRPLSEPESRTARRLIRRLQPDVTIWFHQPFGLVDRSGAAPAVERRFADLIGLPHRRIARPPGSASSWQNRAMPESNAFVVELPGVVSAALVRRAARAVLRLTDEYSADSVSEGRPLDRR